MSKAIENLETAFQRAMAIRLKVGGSRTWPRPCDWQALRAISGSFARMSELVFDGIWAGRDDWYSLASGAVDVPVFNREALIAALRTDHAGNSTFPEFLAASRRAGVVRYDVDFAARTVAYYGVNGEEHIEAYPAVEVD
jgi:Protein of unknown function (DUF1398)